MIQFDEHIFQLVQPPTSCLLPRLNTSKNGVEIPPVLYTSYSPCRPWGLYATYPTFYGKQKQPLIRWFSRLKSVWEESVCDTSTNANCAAECDGNGADMNTFRDGGAIDL